MKKQRILIASTLKPVDDTRAYEKFACALSQQGNVEVFIAGYPSINKPVYPNIHFLPYKKFGRLTLYRWVLPLIVFKKAREVKPEVLIVNTHELLIVAVVSRILFGTKIFYDVQENYFLNLLHANTFPQVIKQILAVWIRVKEWLTSPFFHGFLLAEQCYQQELTFARPCTVVENKALIDQNFTRSKNANSTRLLFSGTLARQTGVFRAIDLVRKLHNLDSRVTLQIVGFTPIDSTLTQIKDEIKDCDFIQLIGGDTLVPHDQVFEAIRQADFGIISYDLAPHIKNRIPTKLYEYLACQLPILIQHHKPWLALCRSSHAAILLDQEAQELLSAMQTMEFYTQSPVGVTWATESRKLLAAVLKDNYIV